ncbi:hypothetical protein [Pararhizobium antarcticum]|uniref:Uncharacterized protein n=1 Tax=Pararhizobium antarcticum TaxID=1798805 RepID=A0A657LWJ9_9HYPH|nr:hypothetical protein [Pararhizobium antarcticum]OJF94124.1 hypothetical protein AX761_19245 [Rhizobium sp. 58]OJG00051.1 hypothetical protein AX760_25600 [Pararhizobium antarcticum]
MNILICDDTVQPLTGLSKDLEKILPGSATIKVATGNEVVELAEQLEGRRKAAASGNGQAIEWGKSQFDSVDLLFIDYNFVQLEHSSGLTGQRLAYLARCYSEASYIVVLNQFGENRFDLTLRDHPETHADLHLGLSQVTNPGLWSDDGWPEFRPWTWPILPDAINKMKRATEEVANALDTPILKYLQLDEIAGAIPRNVRQFLGEEDVTFRQFVEKAGFDVSDKRFSDRSIPLIAASRVSKWLEYMILSAQDILIDAPRVLSRYPSVLPTGGLDNLENSALTPSKIAEFDLPESVKDHLYPKSDWLRRLAWKRSGLLADDRLTENQEAMSPDSDLRFAEDASRFLKSDQVSGFVADLASPFVQRFVRRNRDGDVDYQPQLRFAL